MELLDDTRRTSGNRKLKNANTVLIFGIMSIVFVSIIGILFAIANIMKSNVVLREYDNNPNLYAEKYFKRAKAGKIISITGLVLRALALIILINVFG